MQYGWRSPSTGRVGRSVGLEAFHPPHGDQRIWPNGHLPRSISAGQEEPYDMTMNPRARSFTRTRFQAQPGTGRAQSKARQAWRRCRLNDQTVLGSSNGVIRGRSGRLRPLKRSFWRQVRPEWPFNRDPALFGLARQQIRFRCEGILHGMICHSHNRINL
jgi:hypothetical protein